MNSFEFNDSGGILLRHIKSINFLNRKIMKTTTLLLFCLFIGLFIVMNSVFAQNVKRSIEITEKAFQIPSHNYPKTRPGTKNKENVERSLNDPSVKTKGEIKSTGIGDFDEILNRSVQFNNENDYESDFLFPDWASTDIPIMTSSYNETHPSLASFYNVQSNQQIFCAAEYSDSDEIRIKKSSDNGLTWSDQTNMISTDPLWLPDLTHISSTEIGVALQYEYSPADQDIYFCRYDNNLSNFFSIAIAETSAKEERPAIISDIDYYPTAAYIYIVYCKTATSTSNLMFTYSSNNGTSWSTPISIVSYATPNNPHCDIAFRKTGNNDDLYVVFSVKSNNYDHVGLLHSSNYGSTWSAPVIITNTAANFHNRYPSVAIISNTNIRVVYEFWYSSSDRDISQSFTFNGGTTWTKNFTISGVVDDERYPTIKYLEGSGQYLSYVNLTTDDVLYNATTLTSGSWGSPTTIKNSSRELSDNDPVSLLIHHEGSSQERCIAWCEIEPTNNVDIYFDAQYLTNPPPVADFSGTPTSGTAPLNVAFTDLSTNNPTSWSWTFGDGNSSTSQNPSNNYTSPGDYTVSLTATNQYGSDTETKTDYIHVDPPNLTVYPTSITVNSPAGNFQVTVTSNVDWTVSESCTWLSCSPTGGSNNGSFTVTYSANTGNTRTCTITVSGGGLSETVTVTQLGPDPYLTVSPTSKTVSSSSGNFQVTVTSNVTWSVSESCNWLSCSPTGGSNNGSFTVTYSANTGGTRTCTITVSGGGLSETVTVTQLGPDPYLTVSPTSKTVSSSSGNFQVTVTSNVDWTVSESCTWLSCSPTGGSNNGSFTVTYSANTGNTRTCTITVSGGGLSETVTVTQPGVGELTVSPTSKTVPSSSGNFQVTVISMIPWSVSESCTWLSCSPTSGSNNGSFSVNYDANTGSTRTCTITVSGGGLSVTVTVTQLEPGLLYLTVEPKSKDVGPTSGNFWVTVSSNVTWTVNESCTWLSCSPTSGSNDGSFSVNYDANPPGEGSRMYEILVSSVEGESDIVKVNQDINAINDNYLSRFITIYPNPANEKIFVKNENSTIIIEEIKLRDIMGIEVFQSGKIKITSSIEISVMGSNPGVYFATVYTNKGIVTKKIVIQR